jgi:hypothetical protein
MYRLHIDIPCGTDREAAIFMGEKIIASLLSNMGQTGYKGEIGIRMGHDEDSKKRNHFRINSNGHVSTQKNVHVV